MPTVTLLSKVYADSQLKLVNKRLKSMFKNLSAEAKVLGIAQGGWVQISVDGEDEKAALRYLAEEFGFCPASFEILERFSKTKAYITNLNHSRNTLSIDIGISSSHSVNAVIPLKDLQAKLADGRKIALSKIAELYGLNKNLPLTVKINKIDRENSYVEAFLSEDQCRLFKDWTSSMLDRLIILGASHREVELAVSKTWCNRDVIAIEPLGMFEQIAVCKFGTDARGLVPKMGKILKNAAFTIFDSQKILNFLENV